MTKKWILFIVFIMLLLFLLGCRSTNNRSIYYEKKTTIKYYNHKTDTIK